MRVFLVSIFFFLFFFLLGSATQLPDGKSLYECAIVVLGPSLVGLIAILVLPKTEKTLSTLAGACVVSVLFLGFTDLLHYARDIYRAGRLLDDYSHRWFSDGYLFFLPWLFLGFFKAKSQLNKILLLATIGILFLLLLGSGSRGAMVVAIAQIGLFLFFFRRQSSAWLLPIVLGIAFVVGAYKFAPMMITGAVKRGLFIQNRIYDAWLPAIDFIQNSPWIGYGYGQHIWDKNYAVFLNEHPGWLGANYGGAHNQLLDAGFVGGVFAILAFALICICIVIALIEVARCKNQMLSGLSIAALVSFFGFYLVRGLVETSRWEPLGVTLMWALLLTIFNRKNQLAR